VILRLHAEAVSEIDEAFRYYEAEQSGLGHSFLAALEHGYGQIEDFPNAWPRVEPEGRWYILRKFPFAIVYIEDRGELVVMAVSHLSRRRDYWHQRLGRQA
jgi:ParE toxin of type II toxin-antitoxin system, parDE